LASTTICFRVAASVELISLFAAVSSPWSAST
jgi:hypothetical protein